MSMNIKNREAVTLARELAELTGETITAAVAESLRERLERLRAEQRQGLAVAVLAIGRDVAARLPRHARTGDPAEWLYDEQGLPR